MTPKPCSLNPTPQVFDQRSCDLGRPLPGSAPRPPWLLWHRGAVGVMLRVGRVCATGDLATNALGAAPAAGLLAACTAEVALALRALHNQHIKGGWVGLWCAPPLGSALPLGSAAASLRVRPRLWCVPCHMA